MSEGDLKGYSPPPGDSSSAPNYGCQRRDQHYQPTLAILGRPRTIPKAHVRATPYFQRPSACLVWTRRLNNSCRSPLPGPGWANTGSVLLKSDDPAFGNLPIGTSGYVPAQTRQKRGGRHGANN